MAARKLKVFQAQFGFYDTIVAAPSRAAAMRIWGIRQNVFADGTAREIKDEAAVAAATAHPETVLKRPVGSSAAFTLDPTGLPDVPQAPRTKTTLKPLKAKAKSTRAPADRSKLDTADAALHKLDERRKVEEAKLRSEQEALDAKKTAAQDAYVQARKKATAAVAEARTAYRKDGGQD